MNKSILKKKEQSQEGNSYTWLLRRKKDRWKEGRNKLSYLKKQQRKCHEIQKCDVLLSEKYK